MVKEENMTVEELRFVPQLQIFLLRIGNCINKKYQEGASKSNSDQNQKYVLLRRILSHPQLLFFTSKIIYIKNKSKSKQVISLLNRTFFVFKALYVSALQKRSCVLGHVPFKSHHVEEQFL